MTAVVVFSNSCFRESEPILDFVPFVVGVAKPISSLATGTLYGQLIFEGVRYSGFAANDFCEGCGHFFLQLEGIPVFSYLPTRFPDYFFRDCYEFQFLLVGLRTLKTLTYT